MDRLRSSRKYKNLKHCRKELRRAIGPTYQLREASIAKPVFELIC